MRIFPRFWLAFILRKTLHKRLAMSLWKRRTIYSRQHQSLWRQWLYIADSLKLALDIGNWELRSYCLMVTQANHCIVLYAQMPNFQKKKQPLLNQLDIYIYISQYTMATARQLKTFLARVQNSRKWRQSSRNSRRKRKQVLFFRFHLRF